jgi:hypothetical protein
LVTDIGHDVANEDQQIVIDQVLQVVGAARGA